MCVKQTKVLVDGALSAAIFAIILLISMYTPVIGSISVFLLPLPMIYYATKYGAKPASVTLLVFVVLTLIFGGPLLLVTTLLFVIPGLVIGVLYKRQSSAFIVMVGSSLAFIAMFMLIYIGAIAIFKVDLIHMLQQTFTESIKMAKSMMGSLGNNKQNLEWSTLEKQIALLKYFIPAILVSAGLTTTAITLLVSYPILKRLGVVLPKWPPFREWHFPRSLLWYYLLAFVGILFLNLQQGTTMFTIFWNVFSLLEVVMIIQGFSFVFYYAHYKQLNRSIPIIVVVVSFLIPQLVMFLIRLLGIIDLGFNIRKRMTQN